MGRIAEVLRMTELLDRFPKELSGGQRQRVAIGRAIVRKPKVFLFDEPLSNLDAALRVNMRIELSRLHKELGTTMIYVTHDQVEAMTLATKIVVLRDGRIEQVGSPRQLYDDPDNLFVAGFIGSPKMNFLKASRRGGNLVITECDGQMITIPDLVSPLTEGEDVTVGLRPQLIGRSGDEALDLTIEIVEHLGSETLVHARPAKSALLLTALVQGGHELSSGQKFQASFDTTGLFID